MSKRVLIQWCRCWQLVSVLQTHNRMLLVSTTGHDESGVAWVSGVSGVVLPFDSVSDVLMIRAGVTLGRGTR